MALSLQVVRHMAHLLLGYGTTPPQWDARANPFSEGTRSAANHIEKFGAAW
jgi:hypothetical protein